MSGSSHLTDEHAAFVESVMQEGASFHLYRELHRIVGLAREAGLTRDDVAMALMTHAVALCRPASALVSALVSRIARSDRNFAECWQSRWRDGSSSGERFNSFSLGPS